MRRLGDVIELKRGYDLPAAQREDGIIPIVSSSGVSGTHNKAMVAGPGVITGRYGTIGQVFYIQQDFWPLNTTLYVHDFKGSIPRFVAYFLQTLDFSAFSDKAAVPGINRNHVHETEVIWPPVAEQRAIAELLGALDDKIELNRRMARTLEAMARALFKSWFVDFEPVRAKADGRPTGLPDDLAVLFPNSFGDDGLPEGWELGSPDALVEVNPSTRLQAGALAPYIDMGALPTQSARVGSWIERAAGSGARFQNRDTLIARITPCLENGKTALVDFLRDGQIGWGSTEFIVLRPRPGVPTAFPYLLARHEPFRAHLIGSMTGTSGRQRVPPSAIAAWDIAKPTQKVS